MTKRPQGTVLPQPVTFELCDVLSLGTDIRTLHYLYL